MQSSKGNIPGVALYVAQTASKASRHVRGRNIPTARPGTGSGYRRDLVTEFIAVLSASALLGPLGLPVNHTTLPVGRLANAGNPARRHYPTWQKSSSSVAALPFHRHSCGAIKQIIEGD